MKNDMDIAKYHTSSRSEEVQDIIDRMPTNFGKRVALIAVVIFSVLIFFSWVIRYPDIVSGTVVVNTPVSPIKLVANSSGQLNLKSIKSQSSIGKDQAIAVIENGVSNDTMQMVKNILLSYNPQTHPGMEILHKLPSKISLGEVTNKYYDFLSSVHQLYNFNTDRIFDKQLTSLRSLNAEQQKEISIGLAAVTIAEENLQVVNKSYLRDSFLFSNKVSAEVDFDKSKQVVLGGKAAMNSAHSNYIASRKEAEQTEGKIVELNVQKQEKQRELELNIQARYNDLISSIDLWEQKYLLKAPFDGYVQFLNFWTNKQFVQAGEPLFTVVPAAVEPYGQVLLPAFGAGKVKLGQDVIVKLNDYPYMEYGSIQGKVASISLTTKTEKIKDSNVETYLVTIRFDKGFVTNYGESLLFKHEAMGSAEIIVNDRRLIERLFGNLKYIANK